MGKIPTIFSRAHSAIGMATEWGVNSDIISNLQDTLTHAEENLRRIEPQQAQELLSIVNDISTNPLAHEARNLFGSSKNNQDSRLAELQTLLAPRAEESAPMAGPLRDLRSFTDPIIVAGDIHFVFNRHDQLGEHLSHLKERVAHYDVIALENMAHFLPIIRKVSSGELDVRTAKLQIIRSAPGAFNSVQLDLLENTLAAIQGSKKEIVSDPNDDIVTQEKQRADNSFGYFVTAMVSGNMSDALGSFRSHMNGLGKHLRQRDEFFANFLGQIQKEGRARVLVIRGAYHTHAHELTRAAHTEKKVTREFLGKTQGDSFERSVYTRSINDLQRGRDLSGTVVAQAILSCMLEEYFKSDRRIDRSTSNAIVQRLSSVNAFRGLFEQIRKNPLHDQTLETDYLQHQLHSWLISSGLTSLEELGTALGSKDAVHTNDNIDAARVTFENRIKGAQSTDELKRLSREIVKALHPDKYQNSMQASKAELHFKALKSAVELRENALNGVGPISPTGAATTSYGAPLRPEEMWTGLEIQALIRLIGFEAALEHMNPKGGPEEIDTFVEIRDRAQYAPDMIGAIRSDGKPITYRELYSQYMEDTSKIYYIEWSTFFLFDPGYQIESEQRALAGNANYELDAALNAFHREIKDDTSIREAAFNLFRLANSSYDAAIYVSSRLRDRMIFRNQSIFSARTSYAVRILHWLGTLTVMERIYFPTDLGDLPAEGATAAFALYDQAQNDADKRVAGEQLFRIALAHDKYKDEVLQGLEARGASDIIEMINDPSGSSDIPRYDTDYDKNKHNVLQRLANFVAGL